MDVPAPGLLVATSVESHHGATYRRVEVVGSAAAVKLAYLEARVADLRGQPEREDTVAALGIADGYHVGLDLGVVECPVVGVAEHGGHHVE